MIRTGRRPLFVKPVKPVPSNRPESLDAIMKVTNLLSGS